jgi:hypothetical protein
MSDTARGWKLSARGGAIRIERAADAREYDALLCGAPEATFFHTRHWARIVTEAFPQLEDCSAILRVDGEPHAVPLFRWRRLRLGPRTLHSGFPFLYGGPIPARPAAWSALLELLAATRDAVTVIGNPFARDPALAPAASGLTAASEETHLLALPASIEAYWSDVLTPRKRNDIRRLTQKGVTIETTTAEADIDRVYALYRRRMAAWAQRPGLVYPPALHRAMLRAPEGAVRLYVARHAGRVIGGAYIVYWNGIAHYDAGYFDEEMRSLRPNILIQERVIRDAIAQRIRIYDMLPSAGLAGVEAFKESMGGRRTRFARWERIGTCQRLVRSVRSRLRRPARRETNNEP